MHYNTLTVTKVCLAATMLLPSTLMADGRRFVQRSTSCNHHVQEQVIYPQYVEQQVYYFVGQPLRIESLMRLEREQYSNDRLQQEFKQFQAWRQSQTQTQQKYHQPQNSTAGDCPTCRNSNPVTPQQPATEPEPVVPADPMPNPENTNGATDPPPNNETSLFVQKCGKCHSGATPKGQLTLSLDTTLNLQSYKKIVSMIDSGKMPKGGPPLTANEADQIKSELLQLTQ